MNLDLGQAEFIAVFKFVDYDFITDKGLFLVGNIITPKAQEKRIIL